MTDATGSGELTTEDRRELTELLARYAWAFDTRDGEAYAALFTEDGMLQGPRTTIAGRDALRDWAANYDLTISRHISSNVVIEGDATQATVKSYLMSWTIDEDGIKPPLLGSYHDSVVKEPDGWRIAHRRLVIDHWGE